MQMFGTFFVPPGIYTLHICSTLPYTNWRFIWWFADICTDLQYSCEDIYTVVARIYAIQFVVHF